jgi:hypothetical protein
MQRATKEGIMTKKALLVGINYPGTPHALKGCVNDVTTMSEILSSQFGFEAKNKRMLTDNSATTAAILERLEWLVADAVPGDVLYFHYSGHGSQTVNVDYDSDKEPDGIDEILCPIDLDWREKIIRDDDLKRIFNKVPAGANLTVILDCCHSGSALDQTEQYQPLGLGEAKSISSDSPNKSRFLPIPPDIANRGVGLCLEVKPRAVQTKDVDNTGLLISGCQAHQTSADAWIHNKYMGACTFYLQEVLKENNYKIDYQTLINKVNQKMLQYGYSQRPQLDGSSLLWSQEFLWGK